MIQRTVIILICSFCTISAAAQTEKLIKSRVYLQEKQNKPAAAIPEILLTAYSRGDIKAYYPKSLERPVSYTQFLKHFGSDAQAYMEMGNDQPFWFCHERDYTPVDPSIIKCMQYNFEIGERSFRNHITYEQERKLFYVKVIYSNECTADGLEMEGPVFKMGDIKKLTKGEYKIVNYQNTAVRHTVSDYLTLRLYRAEPLKK